MRRALPLPKPLPPDVRLMNALALVFGLVFAAMVLALVVAWLMRQSLFSLSAISVQGDVSHNNAVTLRANVAPRLAGNFFTVDLGRTRAVFESVPWVRRAVVQRQFPNRLKVVLQEHQAIAYWGPEGDSRLVNNFGEVFEANQGEVETEDLPQLSGPPGQAALVLQTYQMLSPLFEKLDAVLERLELTGQGSWRARLDSGAVLELGHGSLDEIQARAQRFIATLTQVSSRYGRDFESADLRYGNGYALKLRGVTTVNPGDKEDKKAKR
ncbi:MAG: cell division protein FtsQ/DivIB [Pseudomonadota bacterium]